MKGIAKVFLPIAILAAVTVTAQTGGTPFKHLTAFSWEVAIPSDNKYLNEISYSGWRFEYRRKFKTNFSLGLAMSWNAFDEYINTKTYANASGTTAVTSDMIRQVYTLPMTAILHYYPNVKSKMLNPFIGIGLGGQYSEHNSYLNIYEFNQNNWGFVARPEFGTLFSFRDSPVKIIFNAGFNVSTNKDEAFDINGWNQITLNLGIAIGDIAH